MSNAVQTKPVLAQSPNEKSASQNVSALPSQKAGMSTVDKLVWGVILAGFIAVVVYQVFFCPTCYVGGGRVIG
jgi:hypothetical protein